MLLKSHKQKAGPKTHEKRKGKENAEAAHLRRTCAHMRGNSSRLEQGKGEEKEGQRDSSGTFPWPVNRGGAGMVFAD